MNKKQSLSLGMLIMFSNFASVSLLSDEEAVFMVSLVFMAIAYSCLYYSSKEN